MSKKLKFILWIVVAVVTVIAIGIFGTGFIKSKTVDTVHPIVTFDIENYGKIKAELYPEYAPTTVTNIIALVKSGYYENKIIYGKDPICLYLGRDKDGNVVVLLPIEGSPAEEAGLKTGDIITKVNGEDCLRMDLSLVANKVKGKEGTTVITNIINIIIPTVLHGIYDFCLTYINNCATMQWEIFSRCIFF